MSIMEKSGHQRKRSSSGVHYSTKSLRIGRPSSKLSKYWRNKLAESFAFHSKMFVTSSDIATKVKWLTKNKPKKGSFGRKKTPSLTKHMGGKQYKTIGLTKKNRSSKNIVDNSTEYTDGTL